MRLRRSVLSKDEIIFLPTFDRVQRKDLFIKDDPGSKNKTCNDGIITEKTHRQDTLEFLWNGQSPLSYG